MVRLVSLTVLLTLIVILGLTFFKVLAPFLLPLFLAAVFAILCEPIQAYFLRRTGQKRRLASGLTTASIVTLLMVPLVVATVLASLQLFVVATRLADRNLTRSWQEQTEPLLERAADFLNAHLQPAQLQWETPDTGAGQEDAAGEAVDEEDAAIPHPPEEQVIGPPGPADDATATRHAAAAQTSPAASQPAATSAQQPSGASGTGTPLPTGESGPVPASVSEPGNPPSAQSSLPAAVSVEPVVAHQPVTAEGLRQQLERWLRGSMAEIGRKSLGMAGGTLDWLSGSLVTVGSAALGFVIFVIALYYFLADGTQLLRATERLIPVHVEYQRQMLGQFARVVRAVVMATFFAALAQSMATIVVLWMFGFGHLLILFVLCLLMSMIPMLGTWLVWLPCAAWLAWQGHWFQAVVLSVYGTVFVGMLDNLVRTYVLNSDVKLHPLLALISVLGGLQVMGLWGMFVGPIVASCLHALVRIFNHELAALAEERFAGEGTAADIPALAAGVDAPQSAGT